jgi:circadian clock protein KaiC
LSGFLCRQIESALLESPNKRTSNEDGTPGAGALSSQGPTGIPGLDEITEGGLPRGRPTLICGGPGCGKTLLAAEFLIRARPSSTSPAR